MGRSRQTLVVSAVLALGLALQACGGAASPAASPSPSPSPTVSPSPSPTPRLSPSPLPIATASPALGTRGRIVNDAEGYAVTLPSGWIRLDPDALPLDSYTLRGARPEAKALIESAAATMKSGFLKFLAFDTASLTASSFSDMNVIRQPTTGMTLDALLGASVAQIKAIFKTVEPVRSSFVTLTSGRAGKMIYAFSQPIPGASAVAVHIVQFLIVKNGNAYIVSFATTATPKSRDKVFTGIVNTFEVLP